VDVALVGVGSVLPHLSSLHTLGFLSKGDMDEIKARGAVGDLLARYIDAHGHEIDMPGDRHVIGVPLDSLREIPSVIAVAAGAGKIESLRAALAGRYFDVLVTDADTADGLLSGKTHVERRQIHA
jgi:DNA-binding transcriptional regulator LsrR (DeoR family)